MEPKKVSRRMPMVVMSHDNNDDKDESDDVDDDDMDDINDDVMNMT